MVFRFGLPQIPATKMWRESDVLRGLWVTNGVRYTQTVLRSGSGYKAGEPNGVVRSNKVLLVNIEGDNTNSEYTEAFAELIVEIQGKRQELELKDGFVWRLEGEINSLIGALEIPESGVKVSRGEVLRFQGNIPPSLKGSMTLKIPMEPLQGADAAERLREIEFEAELRQELRPRKETLVSTNQRILVFAREEQIRRASGADNEKSRRPVSASRPEALPESP